MLPSMVFNGYGPLVKQCDGFDGSYRSILHILLYGTLCRSCAASVACNMVGVRKNGKCLFYPGVSTKDKNFKAFMKPSSDVEDAIYILECAGGKLKLWLYEPQKE